MISEETWRRLMPQPMTEARRRLAIAQHLAGGGVLEPTSVATRHALQRNFEPPSVYGPGIARLRAERGLLVTTPRPRAAGEVARPYTEGIAARHAAAGTPPPTSVARRQGHEPPRPWTLALEREGRR